LARFTISTNSGSLATDGGGAAAGPWVGAMGAVAASQKKATEAAASQDMGETLAKGLAVQDRTRSDLLPRTW
jgi:hypothetical protein